MKAKVFSVALFAGILLTTAKAQQIFRISQYNQHNFLYNPASAGAAELSSVGGAYRKMWAGMPGGPQTAIAFFDKYFSGKKAGLAVVVYNDETGPTSRVGGELNLSYSVVMNDGSRLMFGLGGQVLQYQIDKAEMEKYIPGDPLLASASNKMTGDASAGIYWNGKRLHLGIAAKQLVQSKLDFIKSSTNLEGRLYRHYFFTGDYTIHTDDENVVVPNFMVKYLPNAPIDFEVGARLEHKDLVWVGASYHHKQTLSAYAGVKIQQHLALGYALDVYQTPLSIFEDGGLAHEISLRYYFKK